MCAKIRATLYTAGFVVNITFFFLKALFCTSQSGRNSPTERKKNWQWEQFKPCLLLSSTQMPVCVHFHLNIPMPRLSGCDGKVFQKLLDRLTSTPDKWSWQIKCSLTEPLTWLLSHVLLSADKGALKTALKVMSVRSKCLQTHWMIRETAGICYVDKKYINILFVSVYYMPITPLFVLKCKTTPTVHSNIQVFTQAGTHLVTFVLAAWLSPLRLCVWERVSLLAVNYLVFFTFSLLKILL